MVSQRVENDATPRTLASSVSFDISPLMTRDGDHVVDEDTEDVVIKDQRYVRSKILLQLKEPEEIRISHMAHFEYNCVLCSFDHRGEYYIRI